MFERGPNLRDPIKSPFRQTWLRRFVEIFFAGIAKATLGIAILIVLALAVLSGEAGGGGAFPTERRARFRAFLTLVVIAAILIGSVYFVRFHRPSM